MLVSVVCIVGTAVYLRKVEGEAEEMRVKAAALAKKEGRDIDRSDPTSTRKAPFHMPNEMTTFMAAASAVVMVILLVVLSIGLWHFIWVQ